MPEAPPSRSSPAALLYDEDCGFCKWSLNKVLFLDRRHRLRPVAIQSKEGQQLLAPIDPAVRLDSWHLAGPDGEVHSGGAAFEPGDVAHAPAKAHKVKGAHLEAEPELAAQPQPQPQPQPIRA